MSDRRTPPERLLCAVLLRAIEITGPHPETEPSGVANLIVDQIVTTRFTGEALVVYRCPDSRRIVQVGRLLVR